MFTELYFVVYFFLFSIFVSVSQATGCQDCLRRASDSSHLLTSVYMEFFSTFKLVGHFPRNAQSPPPPSADNTVSF